MKSTRKHSVRSQAKTTGSQRTDAEQWFAQVVSAFGNDRDVAYGGGRGFGSSALKVKGKLFSMVSSKAQFVVKLPRERVDELVGLGTGEYFDPGHGRLMKEWVALGGHHSLWVNLAKEARDYVGGTA
jgi:hypothetical protein